MDTNECEYINDLGFISVCDECIDENYFFCPECEEYHHINEGLKVYDVNNNMYVLVCKSCRYYNSFNVEYCEYHGRLELDVENSFIELYNGDFICNNAYDCSGEYSYCENCNKIYHIDDMTCTDYEIFCNDCYEELGMDIIGEYHSSNFTFKKLNNENNNIGLGIELELEFNEQFSMVENKYGIHQHEKGSSVSN